MKLGELVKKLQELKHNMVPIQISNSTSKQVIGRVMKMQLHTK